MSKILLIEDDENLAFMIADSLESQSFEITSFKSAEEALRKFVRIKPDIVLTDINLWGRMNGFELARQIREQCNVPIIFITSRTQVNDLREGFKVGNVDYLKKPFGTSELYLRINELLSHTTTQSSPRLCQIGRYIFSSEEQSLQIGKERIHLNPSETKILDILIRRQNETVSKQNIAQEFVFSTTGKNKEELSEGTLYNCIASLREKLSKDKFINLESVPKVGYILRV